MHVEVSVALNFVISYLYNKLPRRRVDHFGEELERGIENKFSGHWYPDQPFKGSGYRCIRVSGEKVDPVILKAAVDSGLDISEVKEYLPADLTVWIDPSEVSYRIGEKGVVKILYSDKQAREDVCLQDSLDREVQAANKTFNPDAQSFKPIDSLSSSLSNLSLSPSSPTPGGAQTWSSVSPTPTLSNSSSPISSYTLRTSGAPVFTTAMFAQTKFGSTKLKTQTKRPSRLSPTELTAFIKQRSTFTPGALIPSLISPQTHSMPASRSRTLSPREPRDPRQEFFDHQRMLQHQQQQQQAAVAAAVGGFRPLSNSMGDLAAFPDHLLHTNKFNTVQTSGATSPETSKAFLDSLGPLAAPYSNLQHLLVAN